MATPEQSVGSGEVVPPPPPGVTFVDESSAEPPPPPGVQFVADAQAQEPPPPAGVQWADAGPQQPVAFGAPARGLIELKSGLRTGAYMLGTMTPEEFAQGLAEDQANLAKYPKTEEQQKLEAEIPEKGLSALADHFSAIPSMLAEGLPSMAAMIPAALGGGVVGSLGGPIGTFAGTAAGFGIGAGAVDYGNSFNEYFRSHGIDIGDRNQTLQALQNPDFVNAAHWFAAKRAGVSAAFNAAGAAVGGKLATRFFTPETKFLSVDMAKGVGGLGGVAAGTQAATETTQGVVTQQPVDPQQVMVDSLLAGITNLVPMAASGIGERIVRGSKRVRTQTDITGTHELVDEQGRPVEVVETPLPEESVKPSELEPFMGLDTSQLESMKIKLKESKLDAARPEEWNKVVAGEGEKAPSIVPLAAFDSDAPISRVDMIRNVEEKQLVVSESEPVLRQEPANVEFDPVGPVKPTFDRELLISKESAPVMVEDQTSPVVSSTRNKLEPVAKVHVSERSDMQGRRILVVEDVMKPDQIPTESDWGELVVQRVGRYAAESGFEAVSWPKGDGHVEPPETTTPSAGSADISQRNPNELPPVKRVSDQVHAERITVTVKGRRGQKVKLDAVKSADFASDMQARPIRAKEKNKIEGIVGPGVANDKSMAGLVFAAQQTIKALREILPKFSLAKPLQIILTRGQSTSFGDFHDAGTHYEIRLHLDTHNRSVANAMAKGRPADPVVSVYTSLWHEFGHTIAMDKWGTADHSTQQLFMDRWKEEMITPLADHTRTEGQNELARRNYAKVLQFGLPDSLPNAMTLGKIAPLHFHYITSFSEWFAEQVVKWSTTSAKPRTVLERWFHALHQKLEELFKLFKTKFPHLSGEAVPEIQTWLDEFVKDVGPQFNVGWYAQAARSKIASIKALVRGGMPNVPAVPQTPASAFTQMMMQKTFGTLTPAQGTVAPLIDKYNTFYKYMLALPQLAARNPHIWGLQRYTETIRVMNTFRHSMLDRAQTTVKLWEGIGRKNGAILNALLEEYTDMSYRSPAEITAGVKRQPTVPELQSMFQRLGVTPEVQAAFQQIRDDFHFMLDQYADNLITSAQQISTPLRSAMAIANVQREVARMKGVPYFPWMRFGNYTLTVRDGTGKVVHFETFELERQRNRAAELAKNVYPTQGQNAFQIFMGALPEDVKPLLGMPPGLMDKIQDTLNLSPNQLKMMEELRFELAPGQSFKHRFQMKKRTAGYSDNFLRSYANYMFHGSSHIARTKYVESMKRFIAHTRAESEFMPNTQDSQDGTRRSKIASFMDQHLAQIIDAKSDFVKLKGMIFHFALGFNPAVAAMNLSQQLIGTLPFVMSKFGDVRGMASVIGAQTRWKTYWKEGTYQGLAATDFHSRAMAESIKGGVLTEAMAPELAAASEDRNMLKYFGNASEKVWHHVGKASSWMFQMTEKMNRRVTFSAVLDLAMRDPANKYVQDVVRANQIEYTRLRGEGWTHQETSAYLAATDAVRATQFEYASWARPKMFSGKAGALFIFKSFQVNTMFMLWNYPSAAVRSLLIMGFLGGMMGIPGTEDLADILKVLAYQLFGKNFDLEREARKFVNDVSDGTVDPGLVLHGISREGYGIPAVMDMLGELTGVGDVPMPVVDRSRNIGVGPLLPAPLAPFLGPVADPNQAIAQTTQRASGAAFSVGFNIYKTLVDPQLSAWDMKRWERAMPASLRNVSRMFRVYREGMERSAGGNPVQTFDPNDTEQMMEILSMGAGYQPLSLTARYDQMRFLNDAKAFYDLRHNGLLRQLSTAYVMKDREEIQHVLDAIKKFNKELPKEARGYALTHDAIQASVRARAKNFKILKKGGTIQKRDAGLVKVLDPLVPELEVARKTVH